MVEKRRKENADAQSKFFIETARELGCEDGPDAEEVMKHLVAQERRPPKKHAPKPRPKKAAK